MEFYCTNIVQVTSESEHALLLLVVPDLDLVVIAAADEHVLRVMEVNGSDGAYIDKS